MGSGASLPSLSAATSLPPDDAIKYAKRYQMKPEELRYIFRRFCVLCKTNGRTLVPSDVSRAASLIGHDLSKRVIIVMAGHAKGGVVDFDNFLQTYRKFRPGQPLDPKLQFAFDIFDQDGDGRLAYLELCQLIQLLRSELQAPQIAQVAKDFIVFAFECAGRSSIGNPEDECLEFQDFCSVAKAIPGISHILSIDVSEAFNSEKARILEHLKKSEDSEGSKSSAEKIVMKET